MYSFHNAAAVCSFCSCPQNVKIRQCLKASLLISSSLHKIHTSLLLYRDQYIGLQKISIHNKNGTYSCVICLLLWGLGDSELQFGVKHPEAGVKPMLQFWHLNLIFVCFCGTHDIIFIYLFEAINHYFSLWASWWKGLIFPMGWFEVKAPFHLL